MLQSLACLHLCFSRRADPHSPVSAAQPRLSKARGAGWEPAADWQSACRGYREAFYRRRHSFPAGAQHHVLQRTFIPLPVKTPPNRGVFRSSVLEQKSRKLIGKIEHHVMSAWHRTSFPTHLFRPLVACLKRRALRVTRRENMSDVFNAVEAAPEFDRLFESRNRLRSALPVDPCGILRVDPEDFGRNRVDLPSVARVLR